MSSELHHTLAGIFTVEPRKFSGDETHDFKSRLTSEEFSFWNTQPPEEIIIATGSYRKALLVAYESTGLVRPAFNRDTGEVISTAEGPLHFQNYLYTQVRNGNGSVKVKTMVGYFKGVPIFIEPSEEGTDNNDAVEQAQLKILNLAKKYLGKNVLLIATDSVTLPDGIQSPLGKPMNDEGFIEETFDAREYFVQNYGLGRKIRQYNGEAFLFTNEVAQSQFEEGYTDAVLTAMQSWLSTLTVELTEDVYESILSQAAMIVSTDAAGGGLFQNAIRFSDFQEQAAIEKMYDPHTARKLLQVQVLTELRQWYAYDSIAGLGWWDIIAEIESYLQNKQLLTLSNLP